ncbi:MAG: F0F1 ATP synthase subunit A [Bacteroidota bacterium]|nr:F0F1 ATP synthase subunit A [Bacteroidota bacterium]
MFSTNSDTSIQQTVTDSLHAAAQSGEHGTESGNLFTQLLHHVYDSNELDLPFIGQVHLPHFAPIQIGDLTIDVSITKHVVFLWAAAILLIILAVTAARKNSKREVPHGFGNLIEVFILFIRDEVVLPNMGKGGIKYLPYLLTTFFFILIMNLAGLVPYGSTSTSNVSVTAALAFIAFIMIQLSAIRAQGIGHYLKHLTGGVHWILWPIMIPIEVLGLFTKPFALMIRLFANMIGGHIVIISLIGLIFVFQSWIIAPIPILFVLGINLLELFVAFLQAYIFTMLTSLFMGLGMQAAHEGGTHNESGH